jgi:hypothetical protein
MTRFRTAAAIFGAALAASTLVGSPQEPPQRKTQGSPQRGVAIPTGEALPPATGETGDISTFVVPLDRDLELRPLTKLMAEVRRDHSVEVSLVPGENDNARPMIRVRGEQVKEASKAIMVALRDKTRWEPTTVDRVVWLTPANGNRDLPSREVSEVIRSVAHDGVQASMVTVPGQDSQIPIRLVGTKEKVDQAAEEIARWSSDRERWLESDRRTLEKSTVTLDFPGGTVEEFLQAVIGKFNFVPPIYQDESFRKLNMRPVKSRLTDIPAALNILTRVPPLDASGSPVPLRATFDDGNPNTWARLNLYDLNERLFRSVMVIDRAGGTKSASVQIRRAAFTLGEDAPKRDAVDTMLDAISVAISLDGQSQTFRAKFHAPSNILILQGTPDELAVAGQIVKGKFPKSAVEVPAAAEPGVVPAEEKSPARP